MGPSFLPSRSRASTLSPPPCRPSPRSLAGLQPCGASRGGTNTAKSQGDPSALSCHFTEAQLRETEPSTSFPQGHPPGQLAVLLDALAAAPSPAQGSAGARSEEGWAEGRPPPPPTPLCTAGKAPVTSPKLPQPAPSRARTLETGKRLFTFMHWRRKWQPTPVFLPGESQGRGAWWAAVYGVAQSRIRPRPRGCSGLGEPRPALPSF